MHRVRIGLALPHYEFSFPDGSFSWTRVAEAAQMADSLGYDSLWVSDHFFLDLARYGASDELRGAVEPFTAMGALAVLTERARLGMLVACAPFRHPAHVAKMSTAIDLASGGRFELGLGAGWYEREFEAFGYRFPDVDERFSMLEESARALRALFGEGPVDLEGPHVRLSHAFNRPRPAQPAGPPIWIGGKGGDRLLRLVAAHADGWNTVWRWTPEAHGKRARRLRELCEEQERDPATVRMSVGLLALVGEDDGDLRARFRALQRWTPGGALDAVLLEDYGRETLTGTAETCLERLALFSENGVDEVIVSGASLPFAIYDWSMVELIAKELVPQAKLV